MIRKINNSNKTDIIKYINTYPIDVNQNSTTSIKNWNVGDVKIFNKAKVNKLNDIRQYYQIK